MTFELLKLKIGDIKQKELVLSKRERNIMRQIKDYENIPIGWYFLIIWAVIQFIIVLLITGGKL